MRSCKMGAVEPPQAQMEKLSVANKDTPFADLVAEKKPYYQKRIELFEGFAAREKQRIEAAKQAAVPIKIVLPDGGVKQGIKGATTPLDVANEISKSLAKKVVVAKVDGEGWDLFRPLEGDCALQLINWDDPEGKEVRKEQHQGHRVEIARGWHLQQLNRLGAARSAPAQRWASQLT